jgi:hypothetical protein
MKRVQIRSNLTAQLVNHEPHEGSHKPNCALFIHCPDCHTVRGFRFNSTLQQIRDGRAGTAKTTTFCEVCHRQFEFSFGRIDPEEPHWYTKPPFNDEADCAGTIDQMGLQPIDNTLQHAASPEPSTSTGE